MTITNEDLFEIPVLDSVSLRDKLRPPHGESRTQLHLFGPRIGITDRVSFESIDRWYGQKVDRASVFRVKESPDLADIVQVGELQILTLCGCHFERASWKNLSVLRGSLKRLYLPTNEIGPEEAETIAGELQHLKNLTLLNLMNNEIGDTGVTALADSLWELTHITSLTLARNSFRDLGAEILANSLWELPQLTSLDISNNKIGELGARALAEPLVKLTRLTSLDLTGTGIGKAGTEAFTKPLMKLIRLTSLNLADNKIGDDGVAAVANSLEKLTRLKSLNLADNEIGEIGATALAESLGKLSRLTSLNLAHNRIGNVGVAHLAGPLGKLTRLTSLNLAHNEIGEIGAAALAESLGELTRLTLLDLADNEIGNVGVEAVAESLGKLTELTSLNLASNRIGDGGVVAIAESLQEVTQLEFLNLSLNRITDAGAMALAVAMQKHGGLTAVSLTSNFISDVGIRAFAELYVSQKWPHFETIRCSFNLIRCVEASLLETGDAARIFLAVLSGIALSHARVMVVGMGGVGKSSLVRRCFMNEIEPPSPHLPTHDIDMIPFSSCEWKPRPQTAPDADSISKQVETVVWDFGGQLVLHGFHEAFLPNDGRTIYILVLDAMQAAEYGPSEQDGQTGNRLSYWLRTLRHFAGDLTPVVLAITKCDEPDSLWEIARPVELTHENVKQNWILTEISKPELDQFGEIFGVRVTSIVQPCSARRNEIPIEGLQSAIEQALGTLPSLTDAGCGKVNREFPHLKDHVDREVARTTLVALSKFREWCRLPNIDVKDEDAQETFLRQLHHLGSLSYFGRTRMERRQNDRDAANLPPGQFRWLREDRSGDLQRWLFNPNWLKHAVYAIIRRADRQAWITEDELAREIQIGTREFVHGDPNLRTVDDTNADQEMLSVKEFLKASELCWFCCAHGYLFPRGLRNPVPDSTGWPYSTICWDYLPEANFHRFIVHLHRTARVVRVERKDEWYHGRNWVLMHDLPLNETDVKDVLTKALVVSFPADGLIEIRFNPLGDQLRWRSILDEVLKLFVQEYQRKTALVESFGWNDGEATDASKESSMISNPKSAFIKSDSWATMAAEAGATREVSASRVKNTSKMTEMEKSRRVIEQIRRKGTSEKPIDLDVVKNRNMIKWLERYYAVGFCYRYCQCRSLPEVVNAIEGLKNERIVNANISASKTTLLRCRDQVSAFFKSHFGLDEPAPLFHDDAPNDAILNLTDLGKHAWELTQMFLIQKGLISP